MTDVFDQEHMDSLWKQYGHKPSIALRNLLIAGNQGLVVFFAEQWYTRTRDFTVTTLDDLIAMGMIGLIQAVDKFEWERGYRFSSYAAFFIKRELRKAIMKKAFRPYKSLDDTVHGNDATDVTHTECIEVVQDENPSDAMDEHELKEAVSGIIGGLDKREQYVIRQRFYERKGLREIAEALGITRERVRQIIAETMAGLRARVDVQQKLQPYFETHAKSIYLRRLDENSFPRSVKQPLKAV